MPRLAVAGEVSRLDLERPVGSAVYAAFLHEMLAAAPDVDLVDEARADVILSLDTSFRAARGKLSVTVVHDLGHLVRRDAYRAREWVRQNWRVASAARRSDHLIAPSIAVAHGLTEYLGVPPSRVTLLEPLPRPLFRRAPRAGVEALRQARGLPARYFLFIGRRSRRKNLGLLARAWAEAAPRLEGGIGLVVAGPGEEAPAGALDIGFVPTDELPALLSGAIAWVCPSYYEGCAVGALEAMACGTTPIVAPAGALARTVDRAGLILDPDKPGDWADAMVAMAQREELRASLSNAARKAISERRAAPPTPAPLLAALAPASAPARG